MELWRAITFELITYLIVSIHHTVRLIYLSKNNYVGRSADNRFKSYGLPKFYKDMSHIPHIYVIRHFATHNFIYLLLFSLVFKQFNILIELFSIGFKILFIIFFINLTNGTNSWFK